MAGDEAGKPAVLIIGGLGYIGRFLALYIHENGLASEVRLVDKQLPELAMLAPEFQEACGRDKFMQADASNPQNSQRIFDRENGGQFDYVFNCGGETRYSQEDEVYKARSYNLSMNLGREAASRKIKCFVEVSTGMVYKPDSSPRKENAKMKPWLKLAKWKLQAEEDLQKMSDLNLVILRLAHVYGPYASKFLGTAMALARTYQSLGKELKWLWDKDLRTNTVHVDDVSRALWRSAELYVKKAPWKENPIWNIVDKGNTSQGTLATITHEIFDIPTGFHGSIISSFARLHLDSVVDDVNDETLDPWADLQVQAGITKNNPLNPFMEKELLKDTDLSMDGSAFERDADFKYEHPEMTKEEVELVIESYKRVGWWP